MLGLADARACSENAERLVSLCAVRLGFPLLAVDLDRGDEVRATAKKLRLAAGEERGR